MRKKNGGQGRRTKKKKRKRKNLVSFKMNRGAIISSLLRGASRPCFLISPQIYHHAYHAYHIRGYSTPAAQGPQAILQRFLGKQVSSFSLSSSLLPPSFLPSPRHSSPSRTIDFLQQSKKGFVDFGGNVKAATRFKLKERKGAILSRTEIQLVFPSSSPPSFPSPSLLTFPFLSFPPLVPKDQGRCVPSAAILSGVDSAPRGDPLHRVAIPKLPSLHLHIPSAKGDHPEKDPGNQDRIGQEDAGGHPQVFHRQADRLCVPRADSGHQQEISWRFPLERPQQAGARVHLQIYGDLHVGSLLHSDPKAQKADREAQER